MKEIRNYKNIRRKPEIHGFSPNAFYLFLAIAGVSLLTLTTGFSWMKIICILIINGLSLVFTKLVMSNDRLMKKLLNEKFPTEISSLTRKNTKKIK